MDIVRLMFLSRQMKNRRHEKDNMVTGIPPLTFTAKKTGTLKNYRIYGNTVNGENVGDLITEGEHAGEYKVPVTVEGKNLFNKDNANIIKGYFSSSGFNTNSTSNRTIYIPCLPDTVYTITKAAQSLNTNNRFRICTTTEIPTNNTAVNDYVFLPDGTRETTLSITTTSNAVYLFCFIYFNNTNSADSDFEEFLKSVQIEYGSSSSSYEPYHAPVTTPIYLPEQIRKVGDEAEYIDYAEQKMHRIGADDIDVTLPALPVLPGTNTLTVGTEVQPSRVELTGRIKEGES